MQIYPTHTSTSPHFVYTISSNAANVLCEDRSIATFNYFSADRSKHRCLNTSGNIGWQLYRHIFRSDWNDVSFTPPWAVTRTKQYIGDKQNLVRSSTYILTSAEEIVNVGCKTCTTKQAADFVRALPHCNAFVFRFKRQALVIVRLSTQSTGNNTAS